MSPYHLFQSCGKKVRKKRKAEQYFELLKASFFRVLKFPAEDGTHTFGFKGDSVEMCFFCPFYFISQHVSLSVVSVLPLFQLTRRLQEGSREQVRPSKY